MTLNALRRYKGDLPDGYQVSKVLHTNQRLKRLNLLSLELRRLHADLVMCYKIVFGLVKLSFTDFFAFSPVASEPAETWGIVRRVKGMGLGRGYAPLQLGVWGLAPEKFC